MTASLGPALLRLLRRRGGGRRGHGAAAELVAWARTALEAGLADGGLAILAAASPPYYSSEIDELLGATLDSLGLPEPEPLDALHDAGLLVTCRAILRGELAANAALDDIAWIIEEAGRPDRYAVWVDLVEAATLMSMGEAPIFVPTLTSESLEDHVRQAARGTLVEIPAPSWLPAYLSLGAQVDASNRVVGLMLAEAPTATELADALGDLFDALLERDTAREKAWRGRHDGLVIYELLRGQDGWDLRGHLWRIEQTAHPFWARLEAQAPLRGWIRCGIDGVETASESERLWRRGRWPGADADWRFHFDLG